MMQKLSKSNCTIPIKRAVPIDRILSDNPINRWVVPDEFRYEVANQRLIYETATLCYLVAGKTAWLALSLEEQKAEVRLHLLGEDDFIASLLDSVKVMTVN